MSGTGRMRLAVGYSYNAKMIDEPADGSTEEQLRNFFLLVYRLVIKGRQQGRQSDARILAEEQERQLRAARQAQLDLEDAAARAEAERRTLLVQQVEQWELSQRIRAFVHHQRTTLPRDVDASVLAPFDEWLAWALKVADEITPTASNFR